MKRLQEMQENRSKLIADARSIVNGADAEAGLSKEDSAKVDAMLSDANEMQRTIKREVSLVEAERTIAGKVENQTAPVIATAEAPSARETFRSYLRGELRSDEVRALSTGTTSAGALVAPSEFVADLIAELNDRLVVRRGATVHTITSSDGVGRPAIDNDAADPSWTTEVATISAETSFDFESRDLAPHFLAQQVVVSQKLIDVSALNVEQIVRERLLYKHELVQEKAFLTGTGSAQPLGIFTASASGIPVGRDIDSGGTGGAITNANLLDTFYSVKQQYRDNAVWMMHRDQVATIQAVSDANGLSVLQPARTAGEPDTILGRPVYESEFAPNTKADATYALAFGDLRYYWIADLNVWTLQRLNELYAATSQVGFISRSYHDGMPVLSSAFARLTF